MEFCFFPYPRNWTQVLSGRSDVSRIPFNSKTAFLWKRDLVQLTPGRIINPWRGLSIMKHQFPTLLIVFFSIFVPGAARGKSCGRERKTYGSDAAVWARAAEKLLLWLWPIIPSCQDPLAAAASIGRADISGNLM